MLFQNDRSKRAKNNQEEYYTFPKNIHSFFGSHAELEPVTHIHLLPKLPRGVVPYQSGCDSAHATVNRELETVNFPKTDRFVDEKSVKYLKKNKEDRS